MWFHFIFSLKKSDQKGFKRFWAFIDKLWNKTWRKLGSGAFRCEKAKDQRKLEFKHIMIVKNCKIVKNLYICIIKQFLKVWSNIPWKIYHKPIKALSYSCFNSRATLIKRNRWEMSARVENFLIFVLCRLPPTHALTWTTFVNAFTNENESETIWTSEETHPV